MGKLFETNNLKFGREKLILKQKICLIGDFGVGKTSLIRSFVDQQFSDKYLSTVGAKISRKLVEVVSSSNQQKESIQLLIWDIEGHAKFKSINSNYLRGAVAGILVCDVMRPIIMENIKDYLLRFSQINPDAKAIVIALNKVDLLAKDQEKNLIEKYDFPILLQITDIYLTSAKTGKNVEEMFQNLSLRLLNS